MRARRPLSVAVLVLGGLASLAALIAAPFASVEGAQRLSPASYHLIMGNPSGARTDLQQKDDYLLREPYFVLSYNESKGTPNWVSWHLSTDYLGDAPRRKRFVADDLLPEDFTHISHDDYTGSGFQRGHMCPHSDRAANKEMSYATFVMTNIVPQSSACNEGSWESLESYCRYLVAEKGRDLFIVAGPIGRGGEGDDGRKEAIAGGKVTVPSKVFKVIMVVEDPEDGSRPATWVNGNTRLIAVIMPNDMGVEWDNWPQYRVPVAQVERETGYTFFSAVKDKLGNKKDAADAERIPRLPKKHGRPG